MELLGMMEPRLYRSPIDLPEKKSGRVHIRHELYEKGDTLPVIGMRQALLRGISPASVKLSEPLRVHKLYEEGNGVWMTDLPEELNQIGEMIHKTCPNGHVLVGGLGLGILAATLADNFEVDEVTVVEVNLDVIKLCARPNLGYEVVPDDIAHFLRMHPEPFDYYLLDTWQGTSESTWWEEVLPLKRIIRQKWGRKPKIHCWAEDIMEGQIAKVLRGPHRHWLYEGLPVNMTKNDIKKFFATVGLPKWELAYGKRRES